MNPGVGRSAPGAGAATFVDPRKLQTCIHCGLCLGSCPTYLETGDENESPRGRIYLMRALQEARLEWNGDAVAHLDSCLGCRACEAACPSGVPYGNLIEHTRDHLEGRHRRSWWDRFLRRVVIERVFPRPEWMRVALWPAALALRAGIGHLLPRTMREALELLPEHWPRHALAERTMALGGMRRGRVGLLTGCVMSVLFGETHRKTVALLNRLGWEVVIPRGQGCCGALFAHGGDLARARAAARVNIEVFEKEPVDAVLVNAAGCGSAMKEYGVLLEEDPIWADRAARFSRTVKDVSEWVSVEDLRASRAAGGAGRWAGRRVTYHDACHLAHAQRITRGPRELVQEVAREQYVELAEADVCCGSAGSYNLTEPEMAGRLGERKAKNIVRTGAQVVVTANPGCLMQIRASLRRAGAPDVEAVHLIDFLEDAHGGPGAT